MNKRKNKQMKSKNLLKILILIFLISILGTVSAQHSTTDSLKTELAYAQLIALQTDSLVEIQYSIIEGKNKQINAFRKELNDYIAEKKVAGELTLKQAKELVDVNNALAKSKRANLNSFLIGAGTGVGAVILLTGSGVGLGVAISK